MTKPTTIFYAELQKAYDLFNERLFDTTLPHCLITLQREDRTMGYFSRDRFGNIQGEKLHEIALNPMFFAIVPLVEIMGTIVHEMVHLWQYEHGDPGRGRYHNKQWADKMEAIGLMPSSTGRPGGARTGDKVGDYPIPGGRFLEACRALLDDDFKIAWYDRFGNDNRLLTTRDTIPMPDPLAQAVHEAVALSSALPAPAPLLDLPAPATTVAALMGVAMEPRPEKQGNRSNRSKYTCGNCTVSVWGKPALNLLCGDCTTSTAEIHRLQETQ